MMITVILRHRSSFLIISNECFPSEVDGGIIHWNLVLSKAIANY